MKRSICGVALALAACNSGGTSSTTSAATGTRSPLVPTVASTSALSVSAVNRLATSDVRNGMVAAIVYFTDRDTFASFNTTTAAQIEPSVHWTGSGDPSPGTVAIVRATRTDVLLAVRSESGSYFCATVHAAGKQTVARPADNHVGGPADAYAALDTVEGCRSQPSV